jgi:iron complex outermembrane receptor protein
MKKILLILLLGSMSMAGRAQSDSANTSANLTDLSLEALMDIPIYSVSKMEESTFDAPLSSTVITRQEIKRAGCTTIMEALRLCPGVIVREQSNGNYDIHIRGLDNVPPNSSMFFWTNSTTLVMIDNRPVYNYMHGGTFWETLPIDLNDVERIEVVRGPSSALYGPNAESGVINIITRKPEKVGFYAVANAQYGRFNTGIANASFGYKFNEKISAHVSGNFQNRERTQTNYYDVARDQYVPLDTFVPNDSIRHERYPDPKLSMRKYGYNGFINYDINPRASISIQGGGQNSEVQNMFASGYLTTAKSRSYYGNLRADLYGLDVQASYLSGTQSPQTGTIQWKWDFNTTDVVVDYKITQIKHLVLTPGMSYRRASYDDRKYVAEEIKEGFFNANIKTSSLATYLRADYRAFADKLRLIAAGRVDKFFNGPTKVYGSWQFAVTYKPNPNNIIRIVEARANRAPLLIDNFTDVEILFNIPQTGPAKLELLGNKEVKLLTTDMLEVGYRGKLKNNLEIDFVVFGSQTKNFTNVVYESGKYDSATARTNYIYRFQNLTVWARQIGATLSFNYTTEKLQLRPYITWQYTTLFDYSPYAVQPTADSSYFSPNPTVNNLYSGVGRLRKHLATPELYGGAYINYQVNSHLNINVNPYFMSGYTQLESNNITYNDDRRGVQHVSPKFIMNVVVSYTFFKKLTLFMNFKNCFADKSREFYRADSPGFKVSGGANFEF